MTVRADAHIHLFPGGYQDQSFASRPGVSIDEAACYDSLSREHDVVAALVVGYAGEPWCEGNNHFLIEQAPRYAWIRNVAYIDIDRVPDVDELEVLREQGFVGVSLFAFEDQTASLARIGSAFWSWLEQRNWLVSVNSQDEAWNAWPPILERFPQLRLLVSHLGLPPAMTTPPGPEQAAAALRLVTDLARFPGVRVKLSGFYALTTPGHDYPHAAAWPYVERLVESFSCQRLLWASDFSPCLDWVTFPQTFDLFGRMPFLDEDDRAAIVGSNLLELLEDL